jgi:hypothetical protein
VSEERHRTGNILLPQIEEDQEYGDQIWSSGLGLYAFFEIA